MDVIAEGRYHFTNGKTFNNVQMFINSPDVNTDNMVIFSRCLFTVQLSCTKAEKITDVRGDDNKYTSTEKEVMFDFILDTDEYLEVMHHKDSFYSLKNPFYFVCEKFNEFIKDTLHRFDENLPGGFSGGKMIMIYCRGRVKTYKKTSTDKIKSVSCY